MRNNYGMNPCACVPMGRRSGVGMSSEPIDTYPLAMAYVPWQTWGNVFDCEEALANGTIFPDLVLPFLGKGGTCRG